MDKNKQFKADMMILFVAMTWGFSYIAVDISLLELTPLTLNAFRFGGSFLIAALLGFKRIINTNLKTFLYSFIIGFILFLVYISFSYGITQTSLSNAGFLCGLSVITTPIIAFIFKGKKQDLKFTIALIMSLVGMAMLTLRESLSISWGDSLCIMTAILYGIHLNLTETAVSDKEVDPFQIGVFQLGFTGMFCLVLSLYLNEFTFPVSARVWAWTTFLTVVCTGMAFIFQSIAQRHTTASHAGVIFALEPVFAGVVAYFYAGEILSLQGYIGAILLVLSIFVMEIDFRYFKKIFRKRNNI